MSEANNTKTVEENQTNNTEQNKTTELEENQTKTVEEFEEATERTYQAINNLIPKYKVIVDKSFAFDKAQKEMIKAAEALVEAMETMGDCGHKDLNVGMLNVANMFSMWKNNLIEISDQFKTMTNVLQGELNNLPKELNKTREETKNKRSKLSDNIKKTTKKVEQIKKNKKLMSKNPEALNEATNAENEAKEEYRKTVIEQFRNSLIMLRGSYGTIFESYKKIYIVKVKADIKSQQIFNAQLKDIEELITYTKDLPRKFNTLLAMRGNGFIEEEGFRKEAKDLLVSMGFNVYALERDDILTNVILHTINAVENGDLNPQTIAKIMETIPESACVTPAEEEDEEEILEPIK